MEVALVLQCWQRGLASSLSGKTDLQPKHDSLFFVNPNKAPTLEVTIAFVLVWSPP